MKKFLPFLGFLFLALSSAPLAAKGSEDAPNPTPTLTFEQEKQKLELERLELENEKIKLEMQKMEVEATKTVDSGDKSNLGDEKKRAAESFAVTMTLKAETLAKENKDQDDLLILDFANAEVWNKGVRYGINEISSLAEDRKWNVKTTLDEISSGGEHRLLYRIRNISLLKYEGRERGILTVMSPVKDGDFKILTADGISFDSSVGDVRNACQNPFFRYDGDKHEDKLKILKYVHNMEWKFSDKLEFAFDKDEKLVNIRFGVLDEH